MSTPSSSDPTALLRDFVRRYSPRALPPDLAITRETERAPGWHKALNRACGDAVYLHLSHQAGRVIVDDLRVEGCALCCGSTAFASRLLVGQPTAAARAQAHRFLALLRDPNAAPLPDLAPEDQDAIAALLAVRAYSARSACVELPWQAVTELPADD